MWVKVETISRGYLSPGSIGLSRFARPTNRFRLTPACCSVSVGADFRVLMKEYLRRVGTMELPGLAPSTSAAGSIQLRLGIRAGRRFNAQSSIH